MGSHEVQYEWYLEPHGGDVAHTNRVFASEIGNADEFAMTLRDREGNEHRVWRCKDFDMVSKFMRSGRTLGIRFVIWNRRGNYGHIRIADFLKKAPRSAGPPSSTHEEKAVS